MTKGAVKQRIREIGIVPVVRAKSPEQALHAVQAITAGGIPCVEITMTVPGAVEVIRELAAKCGHGVLIGAGTVLSAENARQCVEAGAQFIVSPALNLQTIAAAREMDKVVLPGALTPTEVLTAWQAGADFVKVFPCGNVGGAKYIKSLKAPFPEIELVPTGGVNLNTAADFLSAGAAALGVGADLVDADALINGNYDVVVENAAKFAAIVNGFRNGSGARAANGN